jgi:hypothetical protein
VAPLGSHRIGGCRIIALELVGLSSSMVPALRQTGLKKLRCLPLLQENTHFGLLFITN